jgi:hypothetical protein
MRAKEEIRAFDEGEKAVRIAADIATFMFKYKVRVLGGSQCAWRHSSGHKLLWLLCYCLLLRQQGQSLLVHQLQVADNITAH